MSPLLGRNAGPLLIFLSLSCSGCRAELVHGLAEAEANRVATALNERGVPAATIPEGRGEQRTWTVTVPTAESARARLLLGEAGLPGERALGLAEVFDRAGLLPTPTEEQARLAHAVQGELVRTLESLPGVVAARVHLSISEGRRGFAAVAPPDSPITASVLLRFRGEHPPLTEAQLKSLVSGAVDGLAPERVTTVMVRQASTPRQESCRLVALGPLAVTPASLSPLRLWLGLTTGASALLAFVVVVLALRSRGFRRRINELEGAMTRAPGGEPSADLPR